MKSKNDFFPIKDGKVSQTKMNSQIVANYAKKLSREIKDASNDLSQIQRDTFSLKHKLLEQRYINAGDGLLEYAEKLLELHDELESKLKEIKKEREEMWQIAMQSSRKSESKYKSPFINYC